MLSLLVKRSLFVKLLTTSSQLLTTSSQPLTILIAAHLVTPT